MQFYRMRLSKAALKAAPEYDRNLFILSGHVHNEISILLKLQVITHDIPEGSPDDIAAIAQNLFITKLIAAKLHEAWKLLDEQDFRAHVSQNYDSSLSDKGKNARSNLMEYFAEENSLISRVRNQFSFHYSPKRLDEAIASLGDDAELELILTKTRGNSLYFLSETIVAEQLFQAIGYESADGPFEELHKAALKVSGWILDFLNDLMTVIAKEHFSEHELTEGNLKDLPKIVDLSLPYFVEAEVSEQKNKKKAK